MVSAINAHGSEYSEKSALGRQVWFSGSWELSGTIPRGNAEYVVKVSRPILFIERLVR